MIFKLGQFSGIFWAYKTLKTANDFVEASENLPSFVICIVYDFFMSLWFV